MKNVIAILAVLSLAAFAGQLAISLDPIKVTDVEQLVYDNETANWLTWGGMYRGVWFNVHDFDPNEDGALIEQSEYWFYHSVDRPWDTADVYLEIWAGDAMGPTAQLDQIMVTAIHYAPVFREFQASDPLVAEGNFWALVNTEMSAGGWPSVLGDGAGSSVAHSFFSDDFILWEPWVVVGNSNYFIRVLATLFYGFALDNTTWGSLKATF